MSPRDVGAALLAVVAWGLTFVAMKYGLETAPPFLLAAMRFFFAAVPLVFFVPLPRAPFRMVVFYGALIGVAQFGLLFLAIGIGMPAGLASLVMQLQAFFTVALALFWFRERPTLGQIVGGGLALAGVALIGAARFQAAALLPFLLTVTAAFCWGAGNILGKSMGRVSPLGLMVWSSLVAPAPMLALSLWTAPERTVGAVSHWSTSLALSVALLSYGGTVLAFSLWAGLLARYPAPVVAPFSLLVPVIGMTAAALLFDERIGMLESAGALVVLLGLAVNIAASRWSGLRIRTALQR